LLIASSPKRESRTDPKRNHPPPLRSIRDGKTPWKGRPRNGLWRSSENESRRTEMLSQNERLLRSVKEKQREAASKAKEVMDLCKAEGRERTEDEDAIVAEA